MKLRIPVIALTVFAAVQINALAGEPPDEVKPPAAPVKETEPRPGAIKAGDSVVIELKEPKASAFGVTSSYTVSEQGDVKIPLLAKPLPAAGLTPSELARKIETAFRDGGVFKEPAVVVYRLNCGNKGPPRATIIIGGEVNSGGSEVPFKEGMRLRDAIKLAGGLTEDAAAKRVKLIRENKQDIFNLTTTPKDHSNNPLLKVGDQIVVPQ